MAPAEHGPDLSAVVQAAMQAATVTAQLTRYGLVDADRLTDLDERCGWMPGTFEAFIEGLCDSRGEPDSPEGDPIADVGT